MTRPRYWKLVGGTGDQGLLMETCGGYLRSGLPIGKWRGVHVTNACCWELVGSTCDHGSLLETRGGYM